MQAVLRTWLALHQCCLAGAALIKPSVLSLPYLVLLLLIMQGWHGAVSPFALPRRVVAQLALSCAAAITAIAAGSQLPPAFSGHLGIDIAMLVESLALLALALYLYLSPRHGAVAFRMPLFRHPPHAPVAVVSLLLLGALGLLQPCLAAVPMLGSSLVWLACWSVNIRGERLMRSYYALEPFLRLFVALWIAAEHSHLVVLSLQRAGHVGAETISGGGGGGAAASANIATNASAAGGAGGRRIGGYVGRGRPRIAHRVVPGHPAVRCRAVDGPRPPDAAADA